MPFVLRQVTPVLLSKTGENGGIVLEDPRPSISNATLAACLRQLASLVGLAADIFRNCEEESDCLLKRSAALKTRLDRIQELVSKADSRTVAIPEGDLAAFSHDHKSNHFKSVQPTTSADGSQVPELKFICAETRPAPLQWLYEQAAPPVSTPLIRPSSLNGHLDDADYGRLMELGATLRRRRRLRSNVLEIETRRPASLAHLREWLTDDEALDDLGSTVAPDDNRRQRVDLHDHSALHRLPSPEEKARVAASQVFTAQVVRLDVTGSGFQRMTQFRRSLQHVEYDLAAAAAAAAHEQGQQSGRKRSTSKSGSGRSQKKGKKKKRRNTIACDGDRRDIQDALALTNTKSPLNKNDGEKTGSRSSLRQRLNLVHLLRTTSSSRQGGTTTASSGGAVTSSDISYDESDQTIQSITTTTGGTDATSHASSELVVQVTSGNLVTATRTRSGAMMNTISRLRRLGTDHTFISGTAGPDVMMQVQVHQSSEDDPAAAAAGGATEQHYELIPSEKEFGTLGNSKPILRTGKIRVKECYDGGRSSSGNWSASGSSCSTRASLADSDRHHNIHQHHPSPLAVRHNNQPVKSSVAKQRSTSPEDADSVLSGDDCSATTTTSTKDGESHLAAGSDLDMETSSVYSCDAEGYYTSFQFDSGLKTLKEGQSDGSLHQHNNNNNNNRQQQQQTTENNNRTGPLVENEYELFGKGSTTTTSSAGTVIFRPEGAPNNRNNSVKRSSQPPEPPPRNGSVSSRCHSNRNSTASTAGSTGRTPSMDTIIKVDDNVSNNKNQLMLSESESKEIADALDQLRSSDSNGHLHKNDEPEVQESRERIRMKTQIERIPAMCVVTPPPSDDESIRSSTSGASAPPPNSKTIETQIQSAFIQQQLRINVAELPILPASEETPIVIKAAVVKTPSDGLVALNQLPQSEENSASAGLQPFSSNESSRSSSLERKRKGARVTLDADGKVVYSSDSLRRRKAHNNQQNPSTFEPGQENRKIDPNVNSAFRPAPIGFAAPETNVITTPAKRTAIITEPVVNNKPLSPPPYRPAPSVVRTQPDGQQADNCAGSNSNSSSGSGSSPITAAINAPITRSDSYRMANVDSTDSSAFQRNDSYRRAQIQLDSSMRLGQLANNNPHSAASGFVGVVGKNGVHHHMIPAGIPKTAGTGQFISGHLADNRKQQQQQQQQHQTQPMSYTIKSPMLVKQMSSPGFIQNPHHLNGGRAQKMMPIGGGQHQHHLNGGRAQNVMPNVVGHLQHHQNGGRTQKMMPIDHHHQNNGRAQKMMPIDAGHPHYNRQASSPAVMMLTSSPVITNPNLLGRRTYGGPRVLVNPKNLPNSRSLNNSLDSSGSSIGLDVSRSKSVVPPSPVVRPPTSAQDRPSFYKANDSSSTSSASLVGYQSLSPPPRMSALPLAVPGDENQQHFRRNDVRYNSLPARFKHQPDYSKWLPTKRSSSSASKTNNKVDPAEDSPEEGGFLEFNSNANQMRRRSLSSASESPTPSLSSCSLDVSFTSSLNETLPSSSGNAWPATEPGLVVHSIGLVKRTTISDFKRKLLRTSIGSPPERKISAVELLKASKPMIRSPGESPVTKNPALENLIRRSVRVSYIANKLSQQRNHKTDVLSSTIAEGRSEEELAGCCDESNTSSSPVNSIASSSVRRQLSFTPGSSGCSTPIETSL